MFKNPGKQPPTKIKRAWGERWIWLAVVATLLAGLAASFLRRGARPAAATWSTILAPENTTLAYFAGPVMVSHDGRKTRICSHERCGARHGLGPAAVGTCGSSSARH